MEAKVRELSPEALARLLYVAEGLLAYQDKPEGEEIHHILDFALADKKRAHSLLNAESAGMEEGQDFLTCLREWRQSVTAEA